MISDIFAKIQVFVDYWLSTPKENHTSNCNILLPLKIDHRLLTPQLTPPPKPPFEKFHRPTEHRLKFFLLASCLHFGSHLASQISRPAAKHIFLTSVKNHHIRFAQNFFYSRQPSCSNTKNSPTGKFSLPSSQKSQKCPLLSKILTFRQKTNFSEKFPRQAKFNRYNWFSTIYQNLNPPRI